MIIAEALDHVAVPEVVLKKAFHVLKYGGYIIIINHLGHGVGKDKDKFTDKKIKHYLSKILEIKNPLVILKYAYNILFPKDHHLRRFTQESITSFIINAGFNLNRIIINEHMNNQIVIKAIKS